MPGKSYGLPSKEVLPLTSDSSKHKSSRRMWTGGWSGIGVYSDFTVEPERWWTEPKLIKKLAGVACEFAVPTNLTHVAMSCDNDFLSKYGSGRITAQLHCEWSKDGKSWTRFDLPAIFVSYYTKNQPTNALPCYVWIPRTKIKAKFWKLVIPEDRFRSDFGDNEWHIKYFKPGTLDNLKDVVVDASLLGYTYDPETMWNTTPSTHLYWVNIGRYIHTGCQLSMCIIFKTRGDGGSYTIATMWMDKEALRNVLSETYDRFSSRYYQNCTVLTKTGFAVGIGHEPNSPWDPNHSYIRSFSIGGEGYSVIGFTNNIEEGVSTTRGVTAVGDVSECANPLGVIPDCIWFVSGNAVIGLTHPDYGNTLFLTQKTNDNPTIGITKKTITLHDNYASSYAGVACVNKSPGLFSAGTYTGDGTLSGNTVDTLGVNPTIVVIKRLYDGTAENMVYVQDSYIADLSNPYTTYSSIVRLYDDYFELTSDRAEVNTLGTEYVWWAWSK